MLLRPKWLRLRGRWVCAGLGTICVTSLALSGCSRAPMARFKSATSASATADASDDAETAPVSKSSAPASERPDPRDAVARSDRSDSSEGRVTIVGDRGSRGAMQRYREGYADLRDRVLHRETQESRDPFLEPEATVRTREFPSTDELSSPRSSPRQPTIDDSVARADIGSRSRSVVGAASLQRPADPAGLARTQPPSTAGVSRLDQLREELRKTQQTESNAAEFPAVADTSRGTLLTDAAPPPRATAAAAIGVAKTGQSNASKSPLVTADSIPPTTTATTSTPTPVDESATAPGGGGDLSMRVQALLASAEWMANQGQLEQAYRNAVLAQHLSDYGKVQYSPSDRRADEVAHRIWKLAQTGAASVAQALPKPRGRAPAEHAPLPANTFPSKMSLGWERNDDPSALPAIEGALPVIAPRGGDGAPLLAPGAAPPAAGAMEHVATAETHGPVLISGIEADALAAVSSPHGADSPVVTALAQSAVVSDVASQIPGAEPTSLTLPAMASLPKTPLTLPPQFGPALEAPGASAATGDPAPPYLDVSGARQLPEQVAVVDQGRSMNPAARWGFGGLIALLLGSIFAFRRRWAAGAAARPAATSSPSLPK